MRRRLLKIWYAVLSLSVVQLAAYGLTGYISSHYHTGIWDEFNKSVKISQNIAEEFPYAHSVNLYARQAGVNPQIIFSIIQAESSFQPRAVSNAGAYGLMQIMPDTWRQINKETKLCSARHQGECGRECYYDGNLNIQVGTYYLAQLVKKYQGNMTFALAAYNAGPGVVDYYGGIPPYAETVKYIETVIGNYYKIKKEKMPYLSAFTIKAWDKAHQVIGWCLIITVLVMLWVIWRLVKIQSSWYWR